MTFFGELLHYTEKKRSRGIILTLSSVALFSMYPSLGKKLMQTFDYQTVIIMAAFFALLSVLAVYGALKEWKKICELSKKGLVLLVVMALLSSVCYPLLFFKGLQNTSAINAVLLSNTEPIFLAALSSIWLKEKFTIRQVFAIATMLLGVVAINTRAFSSGVSLNYGDLYIILACISVAISVNIFKKYLYHLSPDLVVTMRNVIGFAILLIWFSITEDFGQKEMLIINRDVIFLLVTFSIFAITVPQVLWYRSLKLMPGSAIASLSLMNPFFGLLAANIFLGETLQAYHLWGGVLIVSGMVMTVLHNIKWQDNFVHQEVKALPH